MAGGDVICVLETPCADALVVVEPANVIVRPVEPEPEESGYNDSDVFPLSESISLPGVGQNGSVLPPAPQTQVIEIVVPPETTPGQQIMIDLAGRQVPVMVPEGSQSGQRVQVVVPLPETTPSVSIPGAYDGSYRQVQPAGMAEQALAIVWKDVFLAFGCRKGPGCSGCCSFKCVELCTYILLFVIFAIAAIITQMESGHRGGGGYGYDGGFNAYGYGMEYGAEYCDNGALNDTWAPQPQSGGYGDCGSGPDLGGENDEDYDSRRGYLRDYVRGASTCSPDDLAETMLSLGQLWFEPCEPCVNGRNCVTTHPALKVCPHVPILDGDGHPDGRRTSCWADYLAGPHHPKLDPDHEFLDVSATIWYSDAPAPGTALQDLQMFPHETIKRNDSVGLPTAYDDDGGISGPGNSGNHKSYIKWRKLADGQIDSLMLASQAKVRDRSVSQTCNSYVSSDDDRGYLFMSRPAAQQFWEENFPVFAVDVQEANIRQGDKRVVFHYDLKLWSTGDEQEFKYVTVYVDKSTDDDTYGDNRCSAFGTNTPQGYSNMRGNKDAELSVLINGMSNALLRTLDPESGTLSCTIVPMPEFTFSAAPEKDPPYLWLVMMPLLTTLILPTLSTMVASEREDGLIQMYKTEGGRMDAWFVGTYAFFFMYSTSFSTVFVVLMFLSGASESVRLDSMTNVVATVIVWGHAQTGFATFVGLALFGKSRNAAVFCVLAILLSVIAGNVINQFAKNTSVGLLVYLFPPLAYARTCGTPIQSINSLR
jgi:hypothetical protein